MIVATSGLPSPSKSPTVNPLKPFAIIGISKDVENVVESRLSDGNVITNDRSVYPTNPFVITVRGSNVAPTGTETDIEFVVELSTVPLTAPK